MDTVEYLTYPKYWRDIPELKVFKMYSFKNPCMELLYIWHNYNY